MRSVDAILQTLTQADSTVLNVYQAILRYLVPILVLFLFLRVSVPLLTFRREPEIWGWLLYPDGTRLPITHWESVIGRSRRSDIVLREPTVSRNHAVLTRYDDGSWTISDAGSKAGVLVNGEAVEISPLEPEDTLQLGGVELKLLPITRRQEQKLQQLRTRAATALDMLSALALLTALQIVVAVAYLMNAQSGDSGCILAGFGGLLALEWLLAAFYLLIRKPSFEVETIAFFLCTMGMCAICSVSPDSASKELLAIALGLALFLFLGWSVRELDRAKRMRYFAAVAGIGLLAVTLLFGKEYYGAKNWLSIGGFSIQPSVLSKVCFVFVGASTMDRIMSRRNLILFIVYTVLVCACLALMNDFGTALIFFVAFLLIAFLRSGSVGTIALACTALGFAGVLALRLAPHALRRFTAWRHIWDDPLDTGYQQTRALMCIASGGLFGLGAGNGWMQNLFAADSDVVFATISEEWGLLVAIACVLFIVVLGLFSLRTANMGRSSFFVIGSCTAAGILLVQTMFNVLGTLDVLPLTGVTFPFVSNGGSSMICCWGLLAFIKAGDTRQDASFAVRRTKEGRPDGNE